MRVAGGSLRPLWTALPLKLALNDLNPHLVDAVESDTKKRQSPFVGGTFGRDAGNLVLG